MAAELDYGTSPRILAGTLADLEITTYLDGTATDPTSVGTVTVADADGNAISSGAGAVVTGEGKVRYTPTAAALANVNRLTITWAGIVLAGGPAISLTSYVEVVGAHLFTEAEARAFDAGALAASGNVAPTDEAIRIERDRVHDEFEAILNYGIGRRYFRVVLDGTGRRDIDARVGRISTIRAAATRAAGGTTWTAFTGAEVADLIPAGYGRVTRESYGSWPAGVQNVRISGEAGADPIPPGLRLAALAVVRERLTGTNVDARTLFRVDPEGGQTRYATADNDRHRWYGLPDVDAALNRYRRVPVI